MNIEIWESSGWLILPKRMWISLSENCLWEMGKKYKRKQNNTKGNLIKHLLEKIKESLEYLGFPGLNLYLQRIIEPNTFQFLQKSKMSFLMFGVDKSLNIFARSRFSLHFTSHCHALLGKLNPCVLYSPALNSSKCHFRHNDLVAL